MSARKHIISGLLVLLLLAGSVAAQTVDVVRVDSDSQVMIAKRTTLAIMYPEDDGTEINMVGTSISPRANGKADVKRKEGRTRIKFKMNNLGHPQSLGAYYTTYILWAIAPEGQADNIAELPVRGETDIEVTTSFQTFGLIVTAEPHSAVRFPSPIIVAENALRRGTEGGIQTSRIEYSGDPGTLYVISSPDIPSINADYNTPLLILGARRAVEIARRAEATRYADAELRQAEVKLAALEQIWPRDRNDPEEWSGHAREVMRLGENARTLAVERMIAARLEMERRIASETISQAQTEADRARIDADRARIEAAEYREAMTRAEREAAMARERLDQAQTEADRAKAREELARAEAERARLEAHQARQEKDEVQQRLFVSLSEILETRREARGLIVNLSDVLFDFNKATLTPGAREKLSKLAGILLAYPGSYRLEIEGHTDSVGSHEYNMKLSQDRAESVRYYLVQSGITPDRIVAVRGFGEIRPVATNETNEGRQVNRRVELVITDLTSTPGTN
ncbi:MAG TPA: OmpA family protein, partial [Blastocatellia bacterium]|nr:OmpA family protein [Blastocatellia bacterium]